MNPKILRTVNPLIQILFVDVPHDVKNLLKPQICQIRPPLLPRGGKVFSTQAIEKKGKLTKLCTLNSILWGNVPYSLEPQKKAWHGAVMFFVYLVFLPVRYEG